VPTAPVLETPSTAVLFDSLSRITSTGFLSVGGTWVASACTYSPAAPTLGGSGR